MRWRTTLCAAALLLAFLAAQPVNAAPTSSEASDEAEFFDLINDERGAVGLEPLARDPGLDVVARDWSDQMALTGNFVHRPDLAAAIATVEPAWERAAENIGWTTSSVQLMHDSFMNSPGHAANVLGDYNRVGIGVVHDDGVLWVTVNFLLGPELPVVDPGLIPVDAWLARSNGEVIATGNAVHYGDVDHLTLIEPIVGLAPTPSGNGYWLVASDGGIFNFGDANFHGSTGAITLNQPIVGMAPTPTGNGYWLVASDGGIFNFGDANFHGSTGAITLNQPIVGMAPTPTGNGYWLVASDGGIFTFGDAIFHGSTGAITLDQPIVGMAPTATGNGYWLVASDGGIFTFGDAEFHGSAAAIPLTQPIEAMAPNQSGNGYWLVASDGGIFSFGEAFYWGSAAGSGFGAQAVGLATTAAGDGYYVFGADGRVAGYGSVAMTTTSPLDPTGQVTGVSPAA